MKIKPLGLAWGPAYAEATPYRIIHREIEITIYVTEGGDLRIEIPNDGRITWEAAGLVVTIPDES